MKRRTFIKKAVGSLLTILGLSGGTYFYAREVEPAMLNIQKEKILSAKLPPSFDGFKIIQFSDTHIGFHYTLKQFAKLVNKINELNPDLIVFTGDLVDEPNKYNWNPELIQLLNSLQAPFGKYWIYGNHDHGGYGTDLVNNAMKQGGFQLLRNEHTVIEKKNDRIIVAGIDDVLLGIPDLDKTIQHTNPELFTLLLAHEPDFADTAINYPIDVQLSGHSHGGQVRLPFIGHLYTPALAEKYVNGKYEFKEGSFKLYVNKGIGTTRLPYRFLCTPELHLYTLANR